MTAATVSPRPSTTDWDVAVSAGLVRLAAGAALLRWRDQVIGLAGGSADDPVLRALFTYFGVRDLAVGVSALASTRGGGNARRVLTVHGLADTTDAALLVGITSRERVPRVRGLGMVGLAAVTAAAEYAGAWALGRRRTG